MDASIVGPLVVVGIMIYTLMNPSAKPENEELSEHSRFFIAEYSPENILKIFLKFVERSQIYKLHSLDEEHFRITLSSEISMDSNPAFYKISIIRMDDKTSKVEIDTEDRQEGGFYPEVQEKCITDLKATILANT